MVNIEIDRYKLAVFCRRWLVAELALFGSVLRADFNEDSDVDVLVSFLPEAQHSLFDLVAMRDELSQIIGRDVDLVSRRGLESSRNYLRRQEILSTAEVVYGS